MKVLALLMVISVIIASAQDAKTAGTGATVAMRNKYVISPFNPAALVEKTSRFLSINSIPMPFGIKELSTYSLGYSEPLSNGNISLNLRSFGFELYKNYSAEINYARTLYDIFSAGIRLRYEYLNIKNYGSAGTLYADLGGLINFNKHFSLGFSIININSPTLGMNNEDTPQSINLGIAWEPDETFTLGMDIHKDLDFPESFLFGFDYRIIEFITIRGGINTFPSTFSGGISFYYSKFIFDYALNLHNELGATHYIGLNILLE